VSWWEAFKEGLDMKYRATLIDPGNTISERPVQTFSNSRTTLDEWAKEVLKKAVSPDAAVNLYMMREEQIALITKASIEGGDGVSSSPVPTGAGPGPDKDAGPGPIEGKA
jgi:hypothetical protein